MLTFICYYGCAAPLAPDDLRCPTCGRPVFMLHGHYQVLRDLGRGGFGLVYEAFDRQEQRRCAIKTIDRSSADDLQVRREVDLLVDQAGSLHFIPAVYEHWREGGRYYIAMEYISGQTLDQITPRPWRPAEVEHFLRIMLDNVAQMHDAEIVHRDIKPVNIKRTDEGRYVLLDFGIAKRGIDTSSIKAMTLDFAPPEQMQRDRRTDQRSDLYSLAVTTYQLLTSKLPTTALDRQAGKQLVPPTQLIGELSPQLERVLMHMLELEPEKRPDDARVALAELDEPIQPSMQTEQATITVPDQPNAALARYGSGRLYDAIWGGAETSRIFAASSVGLFSYDAATLTEQTYTRTEQPLHWLAMMPGGASVLAVSATQARLYRATDAALLKTLCSFPGSIVAVAPSPDRQRLVVASEDFVQIWRLSGATAALICQHSASERCRALVFAPSGSFAAGAFGSDIVLWGAEDGRVLQQLHSAQGRIVQLAFSPDSDFLAALSGNAVQVWRVSDGQLLHIVQEAGSRCISACFVGSELILVWEHMVQARRITDGELIETLAQLPGPALCAAFAPDATALAIALAGDLWFMRLGDASVGNKTTALAQPVAQLRFSPDGKLLAGASPAGLVTWRATDGRALATNIAHSNALNAVAWLPDGERTAVFGETLQILRYHEGTLQRAQVLAAQASKQAGLAVAPDGTMIAVASSAGVRVFDATNGQLRYELPAIPAQAFSLAWMPDAQHIAIIAAECEVYRLANQERILSIPYSLDTYDMALSADGQKFAVLAEGLIELYSTSSGNMLATFDFGELGIDDDMIVQGVAIAPDASLAAIILNSHIRFWDVAQKAYLCEIPATAQRVVISVDTGQAALIRDSTIDIWSLGAEPQARMQLNGHTEHINDVAFSPDGLLLLSASLDGTARLWQLG